MLTKIKCFQNWALMNSRMGLFTLVNGNLDSEMVVVNNTGQMVLTMRVTGKTIWLMEKVDYSMLMEMCMRDNGKMIKHMVKDFILM